LDQISETKQDKTVKWLEIIELRAAVNVSHDLISRLIVDALEEMPNVNQIVVYINGRVETDWSIHLKHESVTVDALGSKVGRQLKEILREFGLVNHTVWINKEMSN
jgi:hypothetical protein